MVTVKVLRNGDPVRMADVYISADAQIAWGGGVRDGKTDDDGEVSIDFDLPCSGKVVVNGSQVHNGELDSYMTFHL